MNREISFRGKSKETGEWLYGSLIQGMFYSDDTSLLYIVDVGKMDYDCWEDIAEYLDSFEVIPDTVGQFTGVSDVDGDDIYEGMRINQKSVVLGDGEVDFTGYVVFLEGCWVIDNGKTAIPLWSETRENRILED